MYIEMRLRSFVCPDCSLPFQSTAPNAIRCAGCATAWDRKRKREYQKRRRAVAKPRQSRADSRA